MIMLALHVALVLATLRYSESVKLREHAFTGKDNSAVHMTGMQHQCLARSFSVHQVLP